MCSSDLPHEGRYYYAGYKLQAVRTGPWKLAFAAQNDGAINVPASLEKPRLYNLDNEIGERTDVAAANPEVVERLKKLALKMAAELGDGKPGPEVRPAGRVDNPVTLYPTDGAPAKNPGAKKNAKPRASSPPASLNALKIGDVLSDDDAPHVAGTPLAI